MSDQPDVLAGEISSICPGFTDAWLEEKGLWSKEDGTFTVHGLLAVLSHHVSGLLEKGDVSKLVRLFQLIETKLTGSDNNLSNAVATCFLENLMNRVPSVFPFERFEVLLGSASKVYCKTYGS